MRREGRRRGGNEKRGGGGGAAMRREGVEEGRAHCATNDRITIGAMGGDISFTSGRSFSLRCDWTALQPGRRNAH